MHRDRAVGLEHDEAQRAAAAARRGAPRTRPSSSRRAGARPRCSTGARCADRVGGATMPPASRSGGRARWCSPRTTAISTSRAWSLHIFCAIVGFGAVFLNAIYGQQMQKRRSGPGRASRSSRRTTRSRRSASTSSTPCSSSASRCSGSSDSVWKFSQTWIWLVDRALHRRPRPLARVLLPAVKRMGVLMREMVAPGPPPAGGPPPQAAEMAGARQALGAVGADPRPARDRDPRPHGVQARRSEPGFSPDGAVR